jgi:hypothetical protein
MVLLMAIGVGVLLTAVLTGAAYYSYAAGARDVSRVLLWPNSLLQGLVPCNNIGTLERPMCEGAPLNVLAYGASVPLSVAVYAAIAYVFIRRRTIRGT